MTVVSAPPWLAACGPFLQGFALREGLDLETLIEFPPTTIRPGGDAARELRLARALEWARIAVRDLSQAAAVDETLLDLSNFADAACQFALKVAAANLAPRFGTPRGADGLPSKPIIIGMGKLGGRELNFSSDIDLIVAYTEPGETDGLKRISNEEYFAKLVQEFVRLLANRTEDGFVFRVDLMLRPFGSAGPVAISTAAMVDYYQAHGRDWERYALIKARPVAGDLEAGAALLQQLVPFVYRRYMDFDAIAGLRTLKRKIAEDAVARRVAADDLKVGEGGIRECEFIVQSFQLVRGGQETTLRGNSWRAVLMRLPEAGHLSGSDVAQLSAAYSLLRRTENALQMWADEQTHALPTTAARREALATALGFPSYPLFAAALAVQRAVVSGIFQGLFAEPAALPASAVAQSVAEFWRSGEVHASASQESYDGVSETQAMHDMLAAGFGSEAVAVGEALLALRGSGRFKAAPASAHARLDALLPLLADAAVQPPEPPEPLAAEPAGTPRALGAETIPGASPSQAFIRSLGVVEAVIGRSTYLTLLRESGPARRQLLRLCAASPWLAETLARHPILLDQLLDARTLYAPPDRAALRQGLLPKMEALTTGDLEGAMDMLRRYTHETTLRIAAADVLRALPLPRVSDRLSWLAEAVLEAAVSYAQRELVARHGLPKKADRSTASFAVIGYGKLGALEMGYGSDLDLVFVHDADSSDAETTGGEKPIAQTVWMARLAQKVMTLLATQTHLGRAYEVDIQLRPNGNAGLPVVSLASFADYEVHRAWTWEHQALTRARAVVGSAAVIEQFEAIRTEVLTAEREPEKLKAEILTMREKMRAHAPRPPEDHWDIKQGLGGLIDVEFLVQHAVLLSAEAHPTVVQYTDVWRQLEALEKAGCWPATTAYRLLDIQRRYRSWRHKAMLAGEAPHVPITQFVTEREWVETLWLDTFGD